MSAETQQEVEQRSNQKFDVHAFDKVKLSAQEPWLYGVWYFGLSILLGFLAGFIWTPLAITYYGPLVYDPTTQTYGLSATAELFRSGGQVLTGIAYFAFQLIGMIRTAYLGHSQHYLLQTIRFGGDEYVNVPFIVDDSHIENWDDKVPYDKEKKEGIPYHKSLVSVSIPQTMPLQFRVRNWFIRDPTKKWKVYQPFDYQLMVHPGDRAQTFGRWYRGKAPFKGLLLNCPDTLMLGTTVYYGKRYEKDGKIIPVVFVHDSPYSAEQILETASLTGLDKDELAKLDDILDAHTAMDKDYRIEQLQLDLTREKIAHRQTATRTDREITDDQRWTTQGLDDPSLTPQTIFSKWGIVALTLLAAGSIALYELFKMGILR